jgi:autotransporter adhesin
VAANRKSPPKRRGQDERIATKKKRPAHLRYAAVVLSSVSVASLACALSASPARAQVVTQDATTKNITDQTNQSSLDNVNIVGGTADAQTGAARDTLTLTGTGNSISNAKIVGEADGTGQFEYTNFIKINGQSTSTAAAPSTLDISNKNSFDTATVNKVLITNTLTDTTATGAQADSLVLSGKSSLDDVNIFTKDANSAQAKLELSGKTNSITNSVLDSVTVTTADIFATGSTVADGLMLKGKSSLDGAKVSGVTIQQVANIPTAESAPILNLRGPSTIQSVTVVGTSTSDGATAVPATLNVNGKSALTNVTITKGTDGSGAVEPTLTLNDASTITASTLDRVAVTDSSNNGTFTTQIKVSGVNTLDHSSIQYLTVTGAEKNPSTLSGATVTNSSVTESHIDQGEISNFTGKNGSVDGVKVESIKDTNQTDSSIRIYNGSAVTAPSTGSNSILLGTGTVSAAGANAVAIGKDASADGANSVAIGSGATADGAGTTAIGRSTATGLGSSALGSGAKAVGDNSVALGNGAVAGTAASTGKQSVAVGFGASVAADDGTSLGYQAKVQVEDGTALGHGATVGATATGGTAVGSGATIASAAVNGIALGMGATAENAGGIAIGRDSIGSANTIAIGANANGAAEGTAAGPSNAVIIGNQLGTTVGVIGDGAVAIGGNDPSGSGADLKAGANAVALGIGVDASGSGAIGIGLGATATGENSIAIGAGSQATANNTVSFGSADTQRRLTNVASGVDDFDAVNIGQFKLVRDNTLQHGTDTNTTNLQGYDAGGRKLINLADGTNLTDAVTVGQTIIKGDSGQYFAGNLRITGIANGVADTDAVNVGQTIVIAGDDQQYSAKDKKIQNLAAGEADTDAVNKKQLDALAGKTLSLTSGTTNATFNAGGKRITSVGAGAVTADSTDAVIGKQLFTALRYDSTKQAYDAADPGTKEARTITGVKDGLNASDAVNKGQLDVVRTDLDDVTNQIGEGEASNFVGEIKGTHAWANGLSAKATGASTSAFGYSAQATADYATALGDNAQATAGYATALGYNAQATKANSVALGANSVVKDEYTVSVGDADTGLLRRITNVAEATGDTDAVTRGQVKYWLGSLGYDVETGSLADNGNKSVIAGTASGSESVAVGGTSVANGDHATAYGYNARAEGEGGTAVGHGSYAGPGGAAYGYGAYAAGPGDIAIGRNARVEADQSIAQGDNALVQSGATRAVAMGADSIVSAPNAVALGAGSVADQPNTVSVGAPGAERRITNVAPGLAPNDAVNVAQMYNYTNKLLKESRRGIAATAAMSPVLTPSAPGKTTVSASTGFYHGEFGFGVSVAHRLDTTVPVMIQAGYANGGGKEHVGRVGVAVEF